MFVNPWPDRGSNSFGTCYQSAQPSKTPWYPVSAKFYRSRTDGRSHYARRAAAAAASDQICKVVIAAVAEKKFARRTRRRGTSTTINGAFYRIGARHQV